MSGKCLQRADSTRCTCTRQAPRFATKLSGEVSEMRFYFMGPGEAAVVGLVLLVAVSVLCQAADAALSMARERVACSTTDVSLEVHSDQGCVGTVKVCVVIERS